MTMAYRGEVRVESVDGPCGYVWKPVTRWYGSQARAESKLSDYCDEHNLWLPSQIVRGIERGGETLAEMNRPRTRALPQSPEMEARIQLAAAKLEEHDRRRRASASPGQICGTCRFWAEKGSASDPNSHRCAEREYALETTAGRGCGMYEAQVNPVGEGA